MKLRSANITGLFGKRSSISLKFNGDLNIVTGKNGSGKTTIMKLIWYVIGGQIVRALTEVPFSKIVIETSEYTVTVIRIGKYTCRVIWESDGERFEYRDFEDEDTGETNNAEDEPNAIMRKTGESLFFPTFRRIEGGFSSSDSPNRGFFEEATRRNAGDIDSALTALANRLSTTNHRFVCALSTSDIERLLLKQYTEASEIANKVQQEISERIISEIKEFKQDKYEQANSEFKEIVAAEAALDNIRSMIEDMDRQRLQALSKYDAIRKLVLRIFAHSGIKVGRLSLGEAAESVSSDALSAGEKQMLSFLCYNAFYNDSIIFIDEPELSLHIDWQRQLFPTLFSQKSNNQFFIATHSPSIYSRYPDKEIRLDENRGNSESYLGG